MTAPSLTLDALKEMCSTLSVRPLLLAPFAITIDDARWTVGTDGMRLLAVRHDYGAVEGDAGHAKFIREWYVGAVAAPSRSIDLAPLREFFAAHVPPPPGMCEECNDKREEECEECDGDGEIECECFDCGDSHTATCKACNGEGGHTCARCKDRDAAVPVMVGVSVYDARLAAPLLSLLPVGAARFHQQGPMRMTTFVGDDWFAALMPMRSDAAIVGVPMLGLPVEQAA